MCIFNWLKESNRWKHLIGGIVIGIGANSIYCAAYSGIGIASAIELKDYLYDQGWNWIDWALTITGVAIGYSIRLGVIALI